MFEVNGPPAVIIPKTEGSVEHAFVQTQRSGKFLGVARRSPILANGQVPGVRRQYNTAYAEVLEFIINRFGSVAR